MTIRTVKSLCSQIHCYYQKERHNHKLKPLHIYVYCVVLVVSLLDCSLIAIALFLGPGTIRIHIIVEKLYAYHSFWNY